MGRKIGENYGSNSSLEERGSEKSSLHISVVLNLIWNAKKQKNLSVAEWNPLTMLTTHSSYSLGLPVFRVRIYYLPKPY